MPLPDPSPVDRGGDDEPGLGAPLEDLSDDGGDRDPGLNICDCESVSTIELSASLDVTDPGPFAWLSIIPFSSSIAATGTTGFVTNL